MTRREAVRDRARNALWGMFAGDALSMPVHWYYNTGNIARDFDGGVRHYEAPRHPHPEAFMVGLSDNPDVATAESLQRPYDILHEHARFYDASYSPLEISLADRESEHGNAVAAADERYHYHHGLSAGDNTLAAHLVRALMRTVVEEGRYDQDAFLNAFVAHMTTPGRNRDPYTEIYIRHWFENWTRGIPGYAAADCQRRVWSIGSHGGLIRPLVTALLFESDYQAMGMALEHHNLTHRSENNLSALSVLIPMMRALVSGEPAEETIRRFGRRIRVPRVNGTELYRQYRAHGGPGGIPRYRMWRYHTELEPHELDLDALNASTSEENIVGETFATACYPEHGLPLMLSIAARHRLDPEAALLANANAGGDNVHRGMVLGLLVGAARSIPDHLKTGLRDSDAIGAEIDAFVEQIPEW
jgi:ADP-ribosyl-[dinitrogen reductase] hydrolase